MGLFGESQSEPEPVEIAGRQLKCMFCSNGGFWHRRVTVHGPTSSLIGMEWAAPVADCAVCSECGYIHWFMPTG